MKKKDYVSPKADCLEFPSNIMEVIPMASKEEEAGSRSTTDDRAWDDEDEDYE